MAKNILYLKSCQGLPNELWEVITKIVDKELAICWKFLPLVLLLRFIYDESMNRYKGEMNLQVHIRTIFEVAAIVFFLGRYTWILERFDDLIRVFYVYQPEAVVTDQSSVWDKVIGGMLGIFSNNFVGNLLSIFSIRIHRIAIFGVHYFRIALLLAAIALGPVAAIASLLRRNSFSLWSRNYMTIACWGITLNILEGISDFFAPASQSLGALAYFLWSLVIFVLIFMTPSLTSTIIGSAIVPHLSPVIHHASNQLSKGKRLMVGGMRTTGNYAWRLGKRIFVGKASNK